MNPEAVNFKSRGKTGCYATGCIAVSINVKAELGTGQLCSNAAKVDYQRIFPDSVTDPKVYRKYPQKSLCITHIIPITT